MALSIPLAVVATMIGGTLFFLPALRIRGSYFALVTLAFMELMYQLVQVIRPDLTAERAASPASRQSPAAR